MKKFVLFSLIISCGPLPTKLQTIVCNRTESCKITPNSENNECLECVALYEKEHSTLIRLMGYDNIVNGFQEATCSQIVGELNTIGVVKTCSDIHFNLKGK